jgi:trk system potassium uptake protein TrkA
MKPRSFAVIGLGTFGKVIATELAEFGNYVLGIDTASAPVNEIASLLNETVIADARDEQALREAGVGQCDVAVVAIGEDLEANIVCAMNVKIIGVETLWAKANTRTHHRILSRLGVDRVIHAERQMGQRVAQMLHNPLVRDYVAMGNGFYAVNIVVPESMEGKKVSSLKLGESFDLKALEIMRGTESVATGGADPVLECDDRMLVLGRRDKLRAFSDSL